MRRRTATALAAAVLAALLSGCTHSGNGDSSTTNDVQKGPTKGPNGQISVSRGPSPATTGSVPAQP